MADEKPEAPSGAPTKPAAPSQLGSLHLWIFIFGTVVMAVEKFCGGAIHNELAKGGLQAASYSLMIVGYQLGVRWTPPTRRK